MLKLLVALFVFFSVPSIGYSVTYYIDPSGSGSTCSSGSPCTFATAIAKSDVTTIIAKGGSYTGQYWAITKSNITLQAAVGEFPILDGQNTLPAGNYIDIQYTALLQIVTNGTSEITVDGITVRNSRGRGIEVKYANNVMLKNGSVYHTGGGGIQLGFGTNQDIESYTVYEHNLSHINQVIRPWSSGISSSNNTGTNITNTSVHDGAGEGVVGVSVTDFLVEYCSIYNNMSAQLYVDGGINATLRYNLVYGTHGNVYCTKYNGSTCGGAITVGLEAWQGHPTYTGPYYIYGNFVADTVTGIASNRETTQLDYVYIYNNTVVEPYQYSGEDRSALYINAAHPVVKNNILIQSSGVPCQISSGSPTFDYNFWTPATGSINAACKGSNDIYGITASTLLAKESGWNSLSPGGVNGREFVPKVGGAGVNAAVSLGDNYDEILDVGASDFLTRVFILKDQDNYGAGWDAGGSIYTGEAYQPPTVGNIAPNAAATCSSENSGTGQTCAKINNGIIDGYPGDYTQEWASNGEGANAWATLTWASPVDITEIKLYDRKNLNDQVLTATLTFSTGDPIAISSALDNAGSANIIAAIRPNITWVKLTINSVSGTSVNIGLMEFEAVGTAHSGDPPLPVVKPLVVAVSDVSTGTTFYYAGTGAYPAGLNIMALFNKPVISTAPIVLHLSSGGTCTIPTIETFNTVGGCYYTVRSVDRVTGTGLTVDSITTTGSIKDVDNNEMDTFTGYANLTVSKAITLLPASPGMRMVGSWNNGVTTIDHLLWPGGTDKVLWPGGTDKVLWP